MSDAFHLTTKKKHDHTGTYCLSVSHRSAIPLQLSFLGVQHTSVGGEAWLYGLLVRVTPAAIDLLRGSECDAEDEKKTEGELQLGRAADVPGREWQSGRG